MPAYSRRWLKTRDTPTVTTFECRPYGAEVVATDLDTSEIQQQMRHAQQQLAISARILGVTVRSRSTGFV